MGILTAVIALHCQKPPEQRKQSHVREAKAKTKEKFQRAKDGVEFSEYQVWFHYNVLLFLAHLDIDRLSFYNQALYFFKKPLNFCLTYIRKQQGE